ncbi:hypothetical protein NXT3_PB00186 (plasmid) [Sinorhizobium fredii]|uniref:Uncharacterized protein n=1 Tax=Rhizobium fredii TaxID=380 RepID=A0A2L0HBS0_RHIFR|nr:hypothetical protein NXT3_PB00186 [Sinorhizobium fredii]
MSQLRSGRARLALALPRHRELLYHAKSRELDDLFEAYAVAAETLERHRRDFPHREELIVEYVDLCLDIQADVLTLLEKLKTAGD